MAGKICAICGSPSGMYPLCVKCLKLKNEGKIIKCESCGAWHYTDKPCNCTIESIKKEDKPTIEAGISCLICGKNSGDKHFCKSCYSKYRNKSIIVRIDNCTDVTIEEKYADGYIVISKDGHRVRSKDEALIDNYLFDKKIPHTYEKRIRVDQEKYGTDAITPDFYLNELDIYIEHLGYSGDNSSDYRNQNEFKKKIYEEENITVIYTYPEDITDVETELEYKLKTYKENKLNFWKNK